jgi:hypothetical protein
MQVIPSNFINVIYFQETWTPKKENTAERGDSFVLRQPHFSVNDVNAITWIYIDLRSSAVRLFSKSVKIARRWPSKAETCSNFGDLKIVYI